MQGSAGKYQGGLRGREIEGETWTRASFVPRGRREGEAEHRGLGMALGPRVCPVGPWPHSCSGGDGVG